MDTIAKPARALSVGDILVVDDRRLFITAVVVGSIVKVIVDDISHHAFYLPINETVRVAV